MKSRILIIAALVCLPVTVAQAHIQLTYPTQRYTDQKYGPCGRLNDTGRGDAVTILPPGATITVTWDETINHPGHFRISFDDDGQDDFVDPADYDDFYTAPSVLADNIEDTPQGGPSSFEITLPNIECSNCTLQVVQVMTDKPPYGDGNDLYYQCADLILAADAPDAGPTPDAPGPDAPGPDADGPGVDDPGGCGCQSGPGSLPGNAVLLIMVLAALGLMRRRRAAR
jgi:MYXO-CTERM domain-containing protein